MAQPDWKQLKNDIMALQHAALRAAEPKAAVDRYLSVEADLLKVGEREVPLREGSRLYLVAAGKAAIGMTEAALKKIDRRVTGGVVAHPKGTPAPSGWSKDIQAVGAGHPLPDAGSVRAGQAASVLLSDTGPDDVVLVLLSGGGSALLELLPEAVTLEEMQALTKALQRAGADIFQLNTVRRAISRIKGGGLARLAAPARVVTLALSDVLDDRPEAIASGPTVPSPTGPEDARALLERFKLKGEFPAVMEILQEREKAEAKERGEQAKRKKDSESEPADRRNVYQIVGSNRLAAEALIAEAEQLGFRTQLVTTCMEGEAREVGRLVGGIARGVRAHQVPFAPPACLVLGGETTVTVRGEGRGGRNQELALGAALTLAGVARTAVLAFATDGIDGATDAAGALATGETLERARTLKLNPHEVLERNDSWSFFQALGDLRVTGPSGTNVNDLTVVLVYP